KLKRFYGVLERQFRRYFELASRSPENTGEQLLSIMERRLDNVVHRLGFAPSRPAARQLVQHGHIMVNGRYCNIPNLLLSAGDTVRVKNSPVRKNRGGKARPGAQAMVKLNLQDKPQPIPDFLEMIASDPPEGRMSRLPTRGDVDERLLRPGAKEELKEQL